MQTDRTLSRPALTVQDMTVASAYKPILPPVDTPRCDLRPTPGTALQPTKRRKRFRPGATASLTVLRLVRTSVLPVSICPYGDIPPAAGGSPSPGLKTGAFRRIEVRSLYRSATFVVRNC